MSNWNSSFLSNRKQRTKVGSSLSNVGQLFSDVVQESALAIYCFYCNINDVIPLLTDENCSCKLYADDLKLNST